MTCTTYTSVASSQVFKAFIIHSRGCLSPNSSAKMPELTTSWCWISLTEWTKTFVDHGGFPLRAVRYWSRSSLSILAVHYSNNWWPYTMICTYSHLIACWFLFVLVHFRAAFGFTDDLQMCVLGHVLGGYIGSFAVDQLVSALLLWTFKWCFGWSACRFAWFRSALACLRCLCSHDLLVWKRRGRWWWKEVGCYEEYIVSFKSK